VTFNMIAPSWRLAETSQLLESTFREQSWQRSVQMTALLLGPGPRQGAGECRDGEIGRRSAIEQGRQDPLLCDAVETGLAGWGGRSRTSASGICIPAGFTAVVPCEEGRSGILWGGLASCVLGARCLTTLPTSSRAGEPHGHRAHDHRSHRLLLGDTEVGGLEHRELPALGAALRLAVHQPDNATRLRLRLWAARQIYG